MQKIFLGSNSGKVCFLYDHVDNSSSIIIMGHGYLSNKLSRTGTSLAKKLNSSGISTIRFDVYGHGESEGNIEYLTVSKAVDNILAIYEFAKSKGYKKIGLVGSSFTGVVSVIAASHRKFDVLSLKCPVFDYKRLWDERNTKEAIEKWKKEGFTELFGKKLHYDAYFDSLQYDMSKIAKKITCPVLIIHGDKDTTVPLKQAEDLIDSISSKDKKLEIVKGADHFFYNENHFNKMVNTSFEWIVKFLG